MQSVIIEYLYQVEAIIYVDGKEEKKNFGFRIQCDPNAPIPAAKEMVYLFLKDMGKIEDQVKAAQEAAKAEEKPAEPVSDKVEQLEQA